MKKAWLALTVFLCQLSAWAHVPCEEALRAGPRTFSPALSGQITLGDKNGWQLEWVTSQNGQLEMIALQRSTLILKRIEPSTGALINERPLLGGGPSPDSTRLVGLASGEVLALAVYEREGRLDLYSEESSRKISVSMNKAIRSAQIFPGAAKNEAYIVAATADEIKIFKRSSGQLTVVAALTAPNLVRSLSGVVTGAEQMTLALLGLDHKMRILKFSMADHKLSEDFVYNQLGGRTFVLGGDNGQMRIVSVESLGSESVVRVFNEAARTFSGDAKMGTIVQTPVMAQDTAGEAKILFAVRVGDRTQIIGMDPVTGQKYLAAPAGDSRRVQGLSQFFLGFKPYYIFASDGVRAQVQSFNEVSVFPASAGGYIQQITGVRRLPDGRRVVGVLAESAGGVRLSFVTLSK